ncbi:MAG: Na+/H+ antiporter NhaC family protein [Lachnospiraceae bacterium]|nr:Na+/H+ antiporter NhaC family protein [Lachnospiraceae bacterium]
MKKKITSVLALILVIASILMAIIVTATGTATVATFWALVPPIIAIALALLTKEVYSSLFLGIVVGSILACNSSVTTAVDHVVSDGLIAAISDTAGIFLFLVILGILVALINKSGGSAAFGRWAQTHIKTRIGAQFATFVLGVLIFIDDYFNCLTVGSVMLPVTDSHKISRAKLSYLIDATAAPICMIAPISSWAAAVAEYADGTGFNGIQLFVKAIPYNFYSLLTFVFIIFLVLSKKDFGPMAKHEQNAIEKGDLFSTEERVDGITTEHNPKGQVADLLLPILVLIGLSVFALIYNGGFFDAASSYYGDFIGAFSATTASTALPWGALVAMILVVIYLVARKLITFKDAMDCIPKGFIAMVPAIIILTFATSLKNITSGLLQSDEFIKVVMDSGLKNFTSLLPAIIFVVACLLAFATGTSWGTFGILIPIVYNMFDPSNPIFYIGMSACLAGAVCGDHCSPISDTTIMSSAGAQCVHVNHVSTQLPYAITVAVISFICFLVAGFVTNPIICLLLGTVLIAGFFFLLTILSKRKESIRR